VPLVFQSSIEVIAPSGYATPALDGFTQNLEQTFATCKSTAAAGAEGLKIEYRVEMPRAKFAAGQYQAFRDTMDKVLGPLEQNVAFPQK
jgi:hypothetical protein